MACGPALRHPLPNRWRFHAPEPEEHLMKQPTDYTLDELEAEIRRLADASRITPAEN